MVAILEKHGADTLAQDAVSNSVPNDKYETQKFDKSDIYNLYFLLYFYCKPVSPLQQPNHFKPIKLTKNTTIINIKLTDHYFVINEFGSIKASSLITLFS